MSTIAARSAAEPARKEIVRRFSRSLPSLSTTLIGSTCWALIMAASALLATWINGWQTLQKFETIAILYALGAALAFPIGLTLARLLSLGKSAETAFASVFLSLSLSTIGVTAALYALYYRRYYSAWHEDFLTVTWMFQFVFTSATALVQFAVLGVPLFFPVGFVALFVASIWFARSTR